MADKRGANDNHGCVFALLYFLASYLVMFALVNSTSDAWWDVDNRGQGHEIKTVALLLSPVSLPFMIVAVVFAAVCRFAESLVW